MTVEITDANIKDVIASGKPVVVDFWAAWCGPCKMMLPILEELSNEYEGKVVVGKLNVDDNPDTCEEYGIMNIPTMLFFNNGELVNRHVGACRKQDLAQLFDALLGIKITFFLHNSKKSCTFARFFALMGTLFVRR